MTSEYLQGKINWLESKMSASFPVWNIVPSDNKQFPIGLKSVAPDGREGETFMISEPLFKLLHFLTLGLSYYEISRVLGRSEMTIKNNYTNLARKFGVTGGRLFLIGKLIDEGILTYRPSVPEEEWLISSPSIPNRQARI